MPNYTFDGSEGRPISLATFNEWAANYKTSLPDPNGIIAHFFGRDIINKILAEHGCMGIRIYYGIDGEGTKQLMLVGAVANGANLLPATAELKAGDDNTIADASFPCPSYCPG